MKRNAFSTIALGVMLTATHADGFDATVGAQGLPSAGQYSATILPDRPGVVSWALLARVEAVVEHGKVVPRFDTSITELDRTRVLVRGFMLPMDLGDAQRHFLVSAVPPHCPFCLPAGPDAVMEVKAKSPVEFSQEPVLLRGRFVLVKDDSYGLLYQLVDAEPMRE
jgi:hypothetical protein